MDAKPKRRWYQFSLKALLVITTLSCIAAAIVSLTMRSRHFHDEAAFHRSHLNDALSARDRVHLHDYHLGAALAYEQAAIFPWLSPSFSRVPPKAPPEMPRSWIEIESIYDEMKRAPAPNPTNP
jgi:hypothetical protein